MSNSLKLKWKVAEAAPEHRAALPLSLHSRWRRADLPPAL